MESTSPALAGGFFTTELPESWLLLSTFFKPKIIYSLGLFLVESTCETKERVSIKSWTVFHLHRRLDSIYKQKKKKGHFCMSNYTVKQEVILTAHEF